MPKSKHQIPGRVRSAYEFIKAHRDEYSVQMRCRVLEVAPSGYYDWLLQRVSNRAQGYGDGRVQSHQSVQEAHGGGRREDGSGDAFFLL